MDGVYVWLHAFLISILDRGELLASHSVRLDPTESIPVAI